MAKVFVTRAIPDAGLKKLKAAGHAVRVWDGTGAIPRKALLAGAKGVDALLPLLTDRIDDAVLAAAGPRLKVVANYAVGFDNIDLKAAAARGIPVTNAPAPEVSETVAEHAFALMIALAHRIVESDRFTRAGKYKGWGPQLLLGSDLYGKTVGIVGLGRIGRAVCERAVKGFRMKAVYSDPRRDAAFEKEFGARRLPLEKLLQEADVVSLHVPLLPATRHLIGTKQLRLMKKTAFLINTSRGPIVDETALVRALAAGRIGGAGLDVFECEPLIDCDPTDTLELRKMWNVVLTPHTASATVEARQAMSALAADNIIAVLSGKPPLTPAKVG